MARRAEGFKLYANPDSGIFYVYYTDLEGDIRIDEFKRRKHVVYDCPTWDEWVDLARTCEESGLEGLFRSDHYVSTISETTLGSLDAWATINARVATSSARPSRRRSRCNARRSACAPAPATTARPARTSSATNGSSTQPASTPVP
mgnify:CR=1 FL=1